MTTSAFRGTRRPGRHVELALDDPADRARRPPWRPRRRRTPRSRARPRSRASTAPTRMPVRVAEAVTGLAPQQPRSASSEGRCTSLTVTLTSVTSSPRWSRRPDDDRAHAVGDVLQRRRVLGDDGDVDGDLGLADLDADALGLVGAGDGLTDGAERAGRSAAEGVDAARLAGGDAGDLRTTPSLMTVLPRAVTSSTTEPEVVTPLVPGVEFAMVELLRDRARGSGR